MQIQPRNNLARAWRTAWSILTWIAICLIVCAIGGGLYYYYRVDDELRTFMQKKASEQYPGLSISIGNTRLLPGEGVRIRDISVIQNAAKNSNDNRSRAEVLFIDEVFLRCGPTLPELLRGEVNIQHVHIRGSTLRLERRADGSINLADLLPLPCSSDRQKLMPTATIENATVEFLDRLESPARLMALSHVNLSVTPRHSSDPTIHSAAMKVVGSFSNDHFQQATIEADFDPCEQTWAVAGTVPRVRIGPELYGSLPAEMSSILSTISSFRAIASIDSFQISGSSREKTPRFSVVGRISDGHYENQQLQRPITDVNAEFKCDQQAFTIKPLTARYGDSRVSISLQRYGYRAKSPTQISVAANRLVVNRKLLESLPLSADHQRSLLAAYAKFQPTGMLSGNAFAAFNGTRWTYDAELQCNDISLTHIEFPYPITQCRGRVHLTSQLMEFQLNGQAGNAPVKLVGKFLNPGPTATGSCQITTLAPLTIDDAMIAAARPGLRSFIQRLKLRGRIDADATFTRNEPRSGPMDRDIKVTLHDGWVNYSEFPYAISHIQGRIEIVNDTWRFRNLRGLNDRCFITCDGDQIPDRPIPLRLKFTATNIPLDHDLKSALPEHARKMWDDMQPRGLIDHAAIWLDNGPHMNKPNVTIVVSKGAHKSDGLPTDDLRVRPAWFPYPIDSVVGKILYENGSIRSLEQPIQARNQQVRLSTQLVGEFAPDGRWRFQLPKLIVNGLKLPDEQLSKALPHDLAIALERLQFAGDVAIAGELDFAGNASPDSTTTAWNVILDLDEADFNVGFDLQHAHGQARLRGRQSPDKLRCQGDLLIDSVMHEEIHLTDVRGPLWFDGQTLFVGSRVPVQRDTAAAPSLRAKVHGGTLIADATIELSGTPFFALNAQLLDADVSSIARDTDPKHHQITGRLNGGLQLRGSANGWHTLDGEGNLRISEANLYELPLILALVKRLRYGDTDTSAFTDCDLEYRIKGRDVLFDRFDLTGETVTLKGTGWSGPQITNSPENASREISLDFYSIVGREHMFMPILRPVIGEASRQFLLITVRGTLENPETRQEVLPALNDAIRKAFPEISGESSTARRRGLLRNR